MAEEEGLEPPVSREELPTENGAAVGDLALKFVSILHESEFAFSSVGVPSLTLNSGVTRIPSDELNFSTTARGLPSQSGRRP